MNISKKLVKLFHESERNKRIKVANAYKGKSVRIYFYEWSDIMRCPKIFDTFSDFERFASESNIILTAEDRGLINSVSTCFISCKKGTNRICIGTTYYNLSMYL